MGKEKRDEQGDKIIVDILENQNFVLVLSSLVPYVFPSSRNIIPISQSVEFSCDKFVFHHSVSSVLFVHFAHVWMTAGSKAILCRTPVPSQPASGGAAGQRRTTK